MHKGKTWNRDQGGWIMLRTFIVKQDTDVKSLGGTLLDARFSAAQADAAMKELMVLNPDAAKLKAGTVIFIPDLPQFKTSAATSTQARVVDDFHKLVSEALDSATQKMKLGIAGRATERADVGEVLKSAALKKIVGSDKDVALQVDGAQKAVANEERQDKQAGETLETMSKAALAALAQMSKLVG
jgi:hypothetical protein